MKNNNNAAYWRIREANAKARYIKEEIPYLEYIGSIYNDMLRNIQSEINNFFVKYARDKGITLAEAKRRADKLDIRAYEQKAKKYVNERNFSKRANEEMRLYNLTMKVNRLELLKANIGLEITTCNNDYEKFLNEKLEKRAIDEIKRQAGILGKTIVQNAKQIKSIVNGSFYNADFSQRIWGNSSLLKAEIEKQLVRGLIGGKHPRELAQNLRKTITSGRYEAERLMRTELARVQTDAQKESYKTNNVDEYEYIGGQSRICPICAELDGKRFKVSEMRVGENAPPMHPNCRCTTSAAIDENDDEFDNTDPQDFIDMLKAAKESQPRDKRWRVDVHSLEDYKNDKLHTTFGGSCVAITPENDIISVCKKKGDVERGQDLIRKAVENGGDRLDSYDGNHGFYIEQGFEPVSWCKFDKEYAPEGWAEDWGIEEDIIFYRYTGQKNQLSRDEFKASVPPAGSYDEAMNIRDKVIREDNR